MKFSLSWLQRYLDTKATATDSTSHCRVTDEVNDKNRYIIDNRRQCFR